VLSVRDLYGGTAKGVSFDVNPGEILGFYGLVGSGRSSVARTITGQRPAVSGSIKLHGEEVHLPNPQAAVSKGIAYLTEDRRLEGFVKDFDNGENMSLVVLPKMAQAGVVKSAVALGVSGREAVLRRRDREDAGAAQTRLVASTAGGSGLGIWVVITNHSRKPIFGLEIVDVVWDGEEASGAPWRVPSTISSARAFPDVLPPGEALKTPVEFLDSDGHRIPVKIGSVTLPTLSRRMRVDVERERQRFAEDGSLNEVASSRSRPSPGIAR
jgi:energy-coupling factor transporter ATP-binding protein EcfA2